MKNQMTLFLQLDLGIVYNILKIIALSADKVIGGRFSKNFRNTHNKTDGITLQQDSHHFYVYNWSTMQSSPSTYTILRDYV